jgi:hypothetical protein
MFGSIMNFEIAPKSTEIRANWYDARLYCFALNIDGKTGWRLPTKDELNEIYQSKNDLEEEWYWSSTECNDDNAWGQCFYGGAHSDGDKNYGDIYVRAVRDIS